MRSPRFPAIALAVALALSACTTDSPSPGTTPPPTTLPATTTTTTTIPATTAPPPVPGTIGDPYFPDLGNAGLDVTHYLIEVTVDPEDGAIEEATTTITAVALAPLPEVSLDLVGLVVTDARIDGRQATTRRDGARLVVVPSSPIDRGARFVLEVDYHGRPDPFFIPGFDTRAGWVVTTEGIHVVAEPDGARTWFPGNDHPSDKASFTIAVTVPEPFVGVSNGILAEPRAAGPATTYVWHMAEPMATYLATVVVGELVTVERAPVRGVLIADHLPLDMADSPPAPLDRTGEMLTFLESWFGPYPFTTYGHVVVPEFSIALETQTMTVIGRNAVTEETVLHEIAHQWFGNSVSVATWPDIWLSEGFASFAELLWIEHDRGTEAMMAEVSRRHDVLGRQAHPVIGDPGADGMFGLAVYWRGSLTLHALRAEIGDEAMRRLLTAYASRFAHGNASTADFVSLAAEVAGVDLAPLFEAWVHREGLPPLQG